MLFKRRWLHLCPEQANASNSVRMRHLLGLGWGPLPSWYGRQLAPCVFAIPAFIIGAGAEQSPSGVPLHNLSCTFVFGRLFSCFSNFRIGDPSVIRMRDLSGSRISNFRIGDPSGSHLIGSGNL